MPAGRFVVTSGDEAWTVDATAGGEVTIVDGGAPVGVRPIDACQYEAIRASARTRLFVAVTGGAREVFLNGRVYRFDVSNADERRKPAGAGHSDQPVAPMPGTIVKLLVKVGDRVEGGQILLKLEAMKMEMPIRATHEGTVVAIECREGELVQAGTRLLEIKGQES